MDLRPWVAALGAVPALAFASATTREIEECVQKNLPERTGALRVSIDARDRSGESSVSRGTVYWRKLDDGLSRVMLRMSDPPDIRGTSVLFVERRDREAEVFVYLPERSRVKRISGRRLKGSFFGTDFSYEDLERVSGLVKNASLERLDDAELEDRPVWVLRTRPDPAHGSAYERIVSYVDQQTCLPLRTEFVSRGERVHKVLTASPARITRAGERFVPRELRMRDLHKKTETRLTLEEVALDAPLSPELFTPDALAAGPR